MRKILTNIKPSYRCLRIYFTEKSSTKVPSEPSQSSKMKPSAKLSSGKKKQLFLISVTEYSKTTVNEYLSLLTNQIS